MLMQAKNAVGSNTPGAASSAADLAPFHVLRTYRRAAGEKRKAEVNGKAWALHF